MTFENEENELPEFLVATEMVFLVQLIRNATKTHIIPNIKNSDMLSDDIAYLLGYQDLNSFVRAFHIWTSMTISEYKKKINL